MDDDSLEIETRPMECELGTITRADGSATVRQGDTVVTCGVYGPVEVRGAREREDKAVIDMVVRGEVGLPGPKERQLELIMSSCSESVILTHLHPHTAISITIQIHSDRGSVISCMVHAMCMSLLDAALPLRTTFSSLTCVYTSDGDMITDPNSLQELSASSVLTYVVDRKGQLIASHTNGTFTSEQFLQGLAAAEATVNSMTDFYRNSISRKMSRIDRDPVKCTKPQ